MVLPKGVTVIISGICLISSTLGDPVVSGGDQAQAGLQCSNNETMAKCPLCDKDCSELYIFDPWSTRNRPCPKNCFTNAPVCVCKAGFFRHPDGGCVLDKECPPACPWANEEANYCDQPFEPRCQPTCSNPTLHPNGTIVVVEDEILAPQFYCQYGVCHTLVCACKPGHVRHDDTLRCVKQDQCPTLSPAPQEKDDEFE